MVAAGTSLSAFWILALNSWMHTPTGPVMADGEWIAGDWLMVIFNPSFPYRFIHMLLASGLTASFVIAGLSAWRLLRALDDESAMKTLAAAVLVASVLVPLQMFIGDLHGLNTLEHQPAKIAAIEAIWKTENGAPLVLFAVPNEKERRNDYASSIPKGAALILEHDAEAELRGLDAFEPDRPPVAPLFYGFRLMVGIGVGMLVLAWFGAWRLRRGPPPRVLLWIFAGFTFSGWIATLSGWIVTEVGRQPWLVTGVLRTADAVGHISGAQLGPGVCGGYVLLGATWLVQRTEGELQRKAYAWARWGLAWVALGVALVSLATPLASETVRNKWFDFPSTLWLMVLPLASVATGIWVWRSLRQEIADWKPFAGAVAIYVLAFVGLAYSIFPFVVVDRMTIWDAASHPSALEFMLWGAAIVLL